MVTTSTTSPYFIALNSLLTRFLENCACIEIIIYPTLGSFNTSSGRVRLPCGLLAWNYGCWCMQEFCDLTRWMMMPISWLTFVTPIKGQMLQGHRRYHSYVNDQSAGDKSQAQCQGGRRYCWTAARQKINSELPLARQEFICPLSNTYYLDVVKHLFKLIKSIKDDLDLASIIAIQDCHSTPWTIWIIQGVPEC